MVGTGMVETRAIKIIIIALAFKVICKARYNPSLLADKGPRAGFTRPVFFIFQIEDEEGKLGIVDTLTLICDYEQWNYEPIIENSEGEVLGVRVFKNGSLYILHPPNENFNDYEKLIEVLKEIV